MSASDFDRAVAAACAELAGADAAHITCLSHAPRSRCCRVRLRDGQSVIVKIYTGAARSKAAKERKLIESLSKSGAIRTAQVLCHGQLDNFDASVLITTDLGDGTLWRAIAEGNYTYLGGLSLVGHLLADFHNLNLEITASGAEPPETMLEWVVRRQLSILRRDPEDRLARHVEPALDALLRLVRKPSVQIGCHGDLHPANIVMSRVRGDVVAAHLVDFESAVRCPAEYDLAKSIATSSALGDEERTAILAGYGDRRPVSEELLNAFVVFHVLDGWVHAVLLEGRDRSLWRARVDKMLAGYAHLF